MHDSSSAKRTKVSSPTPPMECAAAAVTTLMAEPALFQTIIGFVPCAPPTDRDRQASNPAVVLQTVAALCRAVPGLGRLVGPENEAFWRELVIAHFDFTIGLDGFNVDDYNGAYHEHVHKMSTVDEGELDGDDEEMMTEWRAWCDHPIKSAMDKWQRDNEGSTSPDEFLIETMGFWESMKAFFRGSQYGFLGLIQSDRSLLTSAWPANEDAFSLFRDLLLLQQLGRSEWQMAFLTNTGDAKFVIPCMLNRLDREISEGGYEMLELCGFAPHYWCDEDQVVSTRWTGFDGPRPSVEVKDAHDGMALYTTHEEERIFPSTYYAKEFVALRRFVYENFSDWRRIHVNVELDPSPTSSSARARSLDAGSGSLGEV